MSENFFQRILVVAYVHKEYFTYQFSGESKGRGGGGILHPHSRSFRYQKQRGPEREKLWIVFLDLFLIRWILNIVIPLFKLGDKTIVFILYIQNWPITGYSKTGSAGLHIFN